MQEALLIATLVGALLTTPIAAQGGPVHRSFFSPTVQGGGHEHDEDHYVRPPHSVAGITLPVSDFAVEADGDLAVVLISEGGPTGRLKAITNDGRGLEANWSAPIRVSEDLDAERTLDDDSSCCVFRDRGFVAWLDDGAGSGATRVHFNRYRQATGQWRSSPLVLDPATYPAGADVTSFHMEAERGILGGTYVYVVVSLSAGGSDYVFAHVSIDGGETFLPAVNFADGGGAAGSVGGVSCAVRYGELHLAWLDDRDGTMDVKHRLALIDLAGGLNFFGATTTVSTGAGSSALGEPILEINSTFGWIGESALYVGVAYLQDDGDGTSTLHLSTSSDNGATWNDLVAPSSAVPDVNVYSFDFEIPGDTFVLTWEDDSDLTRQVWRAESDTGASFPFQSQLSNFEMVGNTGGDVTVSSSFGAPDGAVIAFVENTSEGPEIYTAFGDQFFGGEWHDDFPRVSEAQSDSPGIDVRRPKVGYTQHYYNFILGWLQESVAGSGEYELWLGGYRPPEVALEGWEPGSSEMFFELRHMPFQDSFGFVLVSLTPPTTGPGGIDYLGRKTGFRADSLTSTLINDFSLNVFFQNVPGEEGGITTPIPLNPSMTVAPPLHFMAVTWGPFGDLHTITEPFSREFEAEAP